MCIRDSRFLPPKEKLHSRLQHEAIPKTARAPAQDPVLVFALHSVCHSVCMRWLRQFSVDASRAAREQWLSMYHARIAHIYRHRGTAPPTGVVTAAQWRQPSRAPEGPAAPPRASAAARHGALCPTQVEEPRKTRGRRRAQGADAAEHQEERRRPRVPASSRPPEGPRLLHSWRLDLSLIHI